MMIQSSMLGVYAEGDIKINAEIGYEGFYKLSSVVPIRIEVENNLRDINGELQVEVINGSNNLTLYAMKVSLPKGTTKQFVINAPIIKFNANLKINIVEGRKKIISKITKVTSSLSSDAFVIGMLSDDYESIRYINTIPINQNSSTKTFTIHLDENIFPEELEALNMFNIIMINNYDTSKLGSKQYETLKNWVSEGGLLLIGTGPSYNKSLAMFEDDFLSGDISDIKSVSTSSLYTIMENSNSDESLEISILDIKLNNSTTLISEGEYSILQRIDKNRGVVAVASFDFGLEPLANWVGNKSFGESLLKSVLPVTYFNEFDKKDLSFRQPRYSINNTLRNIPELPQPSTKNMVLIFIVYILLIAPISYIVLKKIDKRELLWVTIPVFAIIFSIIIYVSGVGTRITQPLVNIISVINIDKNGNMLSDTYAGVFTPTKNNIRLEADEDVSIKLLDEVNRATIYGGVDNKQRKVTSKVILSPKPVIEFFDVGLWGMKSVILEKKVKEHGNVISDLLYFNDKLTGIITNESGFDLEDCYIITSNQYVRLENIKNGETIKIDNDIKEHYGNIYDLTNIIYKDNLTTSHSRQTEKEIQEFRKNSQKKQVFENYYWNENISNSNIKLIAWSKTPFVGKLLVNNKEVRSIEKVFLASDVNISYQIGNTVEYPFGHIEPKIISNLDNGHFNELDKRIHGMDLVKFSFDMDSSVIPEIVKIDFDSVTVLAKNYVWDYSINDWEKINGDEMTIIDEDIKKYVGEDNVVKLKTELNSKSISLPKIYVKGSVK